jgi:hypothetical protein
MVFTQSPLAQFLASMSGRVIRSGVGLVLIGLGLFLVQGLLGWIIASIGLIPLAAGLFDVCLLVALFGGPLSGAAIRAAGHPTS